MQLKSAHFRTALAAALVMVPSVPAQTPGTASPLQPASANLLGNGGFEVWNNGTSPLGPVGPDLWHALGVTTGTFTQADIRFTRATEDCCADTGGPWVMEISATTPGNFVSQQLEDFRELRGRTLTFSIDVRTSFGAALPAIEIDDGVSANSNNVLIHDGPGTLCSDPWTRVSVRKRIDDCATRVELRIYPDQTVQVNDAMLAFGNYGTATYVPRANPEPGLVEVPLGSVLDWYRFDASIPVPEGFAICDGSAVADAGSPFVGKNAPNLLDRFVRGVTSVGAIGTSGGADSVSVAHTHPMPHTHSGTTNGPSGTDNNFNITGVGVVPEPTHTHTYTTGQPSSASTGASNLTSVATIPAYVGLLKIIRIK